jgi:hypothetical protein
MKDLKFDLFAMLHPKNDRDISMALEEAISEIRSVNAALDKLLAEEPCVPTLPEHA